MTSYIPDNSNGIIEAQLHERLEAVGKALDGDALTFRGGLVNGIDDLIKDAVERIRSSSQQTKLVVVPDTPGGYIEVVQRIVETMRHHCKCVDFIVPNSAYSAGTVLAMSGDAIYMNYYSRLGPIDPQVMSPTGNSVPALGYLVAWERLLDKAKNGELADGEAQLMLVGFDQAELYKYEQARELSISLHLAQGVVGKLQVQGLGGYGKQATGGYPRYEEREGGSDCPGAEQHGTLAFPRSRHFDGSAASRPAD